MDIHRTAAVFALACLFGCSRAPQTKPVAEQPLSSEDAATASAPGEPEGPREEHDPHGPAVINPTIAADTAEGLRVWLCSEEEVRARPGEEIEVTFAVASFYRQDIFLVTFPEDDPAGTMVFYEAETEFGEAGPRGLHYGGGRSWPRSPPVNWDGFKECALLIGWGWRGKSPIDVQGDKVSFIFRPESGITVTQRIRLPTDAAARTSVIHFKLKIEYFVRGDATRYVGEFAQDVTVIYQK